jgi:peptidoglycan biosynthesis protein MviN/MurJ (putative lipid II flippase)
MRVGLASSVVSIVISPFLIWMWGVLGLLVSLIVSSVIGNMFSLYVLQKRYGFYPDFRHALRTFFCSIVSAGFSYGVIQLFPTSMPIMSLLLGSAVFFVSYLFLAPVLGVVDQQDITNLGSMLKGVAIVSFFAIPLLEFERRILGMTHSKRSM